MFTCICGKSYKTNSGFKTHQRACIEFNADKAPFVCVCGKLCPTPSHLWNHQKYCKSYCDSVGKAVRDPKKDPNNANRGSYLRGVTEDDPEKGHIIKKLKKQNRERMIKLGKENPLMQWNKLKKPKEFYQNQVKTRQKHYLDGTLDLPAGIGRGDTVIFVYNGKEFCLRSSYEFIYALNLAYAGVDFAYESIRLQFEGKLYFSDFYFDGRVIEVKGEKGEKEVDERRAFESQGYVFDIVYEPEIKQIQESLRLKLDIDAVLKAIHEHSKKRDFYIFNFDEVLADGVK